VITKLTKRSYIIEMPGAGGKPAKDPQIKVSQIGILLIDSLRQVFPHDAKPVARALTESALAEIGRAEDRGEADQRQKAFIQRTIARMKAMVAAITGAGPIKADVSALRASLPSRPPTDKMVALAKTIAERKKIQLPRMVLKDGNACRAFLEEHLPPRDPNNPDGPRPPSDKQLEFMKKVAASTGQEIPPEALENVRAASQWLDKLKATMAPPPPTEKQLAFMKKISEQTGTAIPEDALKNVKVASTWLDETMKANTRPPSPKQAEWVEKIAKEKKIEPPAGWKTDGRIASKWLDEQFAKGGKKGGGKGGKGGGGKD
jgi:DNA topoisomerase-3